MSLVDSIAAFTVRCDEIDDSRQMAMLLNRQGINTFSSMAFSIGTPNQPPTDAAFEQFAQRAFTLPSMGQTGKLKRLLFDFFFLQCRTSTRHGRSTTGNWKDCFENLPGIETQNKTTPTQPNKHKNTPNKQHQHRSHATARQNNQGDL